MANYNIIAGLPEADYHALPQVGSSTIRDVSVSPAYYQQQKLAREGKEPSPAFAIGSMFHQLILEPDTENLFIATPEGLDRRTKEGKAIWAEFLEKSEGRTVMKKEDYDNTLAMVEAFKKTEAYKKMMTGEVETEVSIVGPTRKCRFDLLKKNKRGSHVAYDLKTTDELPQDMAGWQRFFVKWKYHIQHAWYVDVAKHADIEILAFHFAVVSKRPPYDHAVVCLSPEFIEYGDAEAMSSYELYLTCLQDDVWPGAFEISGVGSQKIEKPRWLK
jgi:exodeoxyribonuclease VIII